MTKQGAELSISVIVMIVLALVVLAVLVYIFMGRARIFEKGLGASCTEQGGECAAVGEPCPEDKPLRIVTKGCVPGDTESTACCLPFK